MTNEITYRTFETFKLGGADVTGTGKVRVDHVWTDLEELLCGDLVGIKRNDPGHDFTVPGRYTVSLSCDHHGGHTLSVELR